MYGIESDQMMLKKTGLLVLIAMMVTVAPVLAGSDGGADFLRTEFAVLGSTASVGWQSGDHWMNQTNRTFEQSDGIGGSSNPGEFGSSAPKDEKVNGGAGNTGEKVKSGLMSAVLPGAGQYYNGQHQKAFIMGGIEVAIWTAYIVFDQQGNSKRDDAEEWAAIYAGTSGEHEDRYWQDVGHYSDSDAYNDALRREARALDQTATGLISGADEWQWVNEGRREGYSNLRADGNSAYDRRDFMILFAVLNRTVSVVDAVIGAGKKPGVLEAEVLGMNLEMQMLPSFQDPGARCVVSRSF